jgi:hypothetical protein
LAMGDRRPSHRPRRVHPERRLRARGPGTSPEPLSRPIDLALPGSLR